MQSCLGCGKPLSGELVKVAGGNVEGTAGTRLRAPKYWHKTCWNESVEFNRKSREESDRRNAELAAALGLGK